MRPGTCEEDAQPSGSPWQTHWSLPHGPISLTQDSFIPGYCFQTPRHKWHLLFQKYRTLYYKPRIKKRKDKHRPISALWNSHSAYKTGMKGTFLKLFKNNPQDQSEDKCTVSEVLHQDQVERGLQSLPRPWGKVPCPSPGWVWSRKDTFPIRFRVLGFAMGQKPETITFSPPGRAWR